MILSNTAIHEALDDGRLIIEPEPLPRFSVLDGASSPYQTTSVDLTLSAFLQVPRDEALALNIDLRLTERVASTLLTLSDALEIDQRQGFILQPNQLVLGRTTERIHLRLPEDFKGQAIGRPCLAARVEGKSSRARFGILVHFTAPTIHAGFAGHITLEIINLGWHPFVLSRDMPICQLIFEEVQGIPVANESQFQNQQMPAGN